MRLHFYLHSGDLVKVFYSQSVLVFTLRACCVELKLLTDVKKCVTYAHVFLKENPMV